MFSGCRVARVPAKVVVMRVMREAREVGGEIMSPSMRRGMLMCYHTESDGWPGPRPSHPGLLSIQSVTLSHSAWLQVIGVTS